MRALIWKEFRELAPMFGLLLGATTAMGVIDVAYNWNHNHFVGISLGFAWVICLAAAYLAGANVFARETDGSLTFLSCWPARRSQIWVAKLLVTVLMVAGLTAISFDICGGLLAMRGYDAGGVWRDVIPPSLGELAILMTILFAFGMMLSTVVRSPMAAAGLAIIVAGGCILTYSYAVSEYLPARWGPWLGVLSRELPMSVHITVVLALSALAIAASAWGFIRAPVLESGRRLAQTAGAFIVVVGAGIVIALACVLLLARPRMTVIYDVQVDPTGHWIALAGECQDKGNRGVAALWVMDVEGRHRRLISRGPVLHYDWVPDGRRMVFAWGRGNDGWYWIAEPGSGRRSRLFMTPRARPADWGWEFYWSPKGTYMVWPREHGLLVSDGKREVLKLPLSTPLDDIVGWSPDERCLYYRDRGWHSAREGVPATVGETSLCVVSITGGQRHPVIRLEGDYSFGHGISPDGRWAIGKEVLHVSRPGATGVVGSPPTYAGTTLIEIATGAMHPFPDVTPTYYGWSPDGRYLWCRSRADKPDERELRVIDTEKLQIVRCIGREESGGNVPLAGQFSPSGDRVAFSVIDRHEQGPKRRQYIWLAQPDGSGLKPIGRKDGPMLGWTHDGDLLVWKYDTDRSVVRINPDTGDERVIFRPPAR